MELGILRFEEGYFPRIWGGRKLEVLFGKPLPPEQAVGEAWLVADHAVHESVVAEGPHRGRTLHDLVNKHPQALLGRLAPVTPFGRFPLLLKLLDARDVLSVQVHPDDACAKRLGESDVGKTEMWCVLDAESGSELICGLDPGLAPDAFAAAVRDGSIARHMCRYPVHAGSALFVPAGVVHALGAGVVLAEIQQNSDLTYRLYDWERTDADGAPRPLHVEKAMAAMHFGQEHSGPVRPLVYEVDGVRHTMLAACRYFAAEHRSISKACAYGRVKRCSSPPNAPQSASREQVCFWITTCLKSNAISGSPSLARAFPTKKYRG
ncbi:MAG: class I mannose-6-phosphate isomerase [Candidatus Hydrogenedentes bacterium]|nr:class I mannose-6-phosphate isomerase [Candidatus Hydrogenedentota bacterium]